MVRYFIVLFLILLSNSSFSQQRTVILTQTQNNAIKGIDRKAWAGLGNIAPLSDGYANDFTLPARINPCEKITNIKVDVIFTGYSNVSTCPHLNTYFNVFYGCTPYTGGATCLPTNVISELSYPVNTNPATLNFAIGDFGGNLSIDIIPISNPGCNPVSSGGLTHTYTTTVTVTIDVIPLTLEIIDPAPVCFGVPVNITLPAIQKLGNTAGTALTYWTDAAATIGLPNPTAITTSGTYYIKSTLGTCSIIRPVVVTILPTLAPPVVTTPITLCVTAPTALLATPLPGNTLNWYGTASTGGTASSTPTIPTATGAYYVSQTNGTCVSGRVQIQVNLVADNGATILNFRCDSSQIAGISSNYTPPATVNNTVLFDWSNNPNIPNSYNYSYRIQGGPPITGNTVPSNLVVTGLTPGQSVVMTLTSALRPCVPPQTITCKVPCPTPLIKPNFPPITQVYCVGNSMPNLSNTSPTGVIGTWSPTTISNVSSGSYDFTPDPILSPCAEPQTLSVTVNPIVAPTFSSLPPPSVCQNSTGQVLPTSSTNAIPITGKWGPFESINTSILGPTTYTFIPNSGQCVSPTPATINVTVNSSTSPTFNSIPAFCAGSTAPSFPISNEGITGNWIPNAISNTVGTKQYQFTPDVNSFPCAPIPPPLSVTVTPNVTPTFAVLDTQCEGTGLITLPNSSSNIPPILGTWSDVSGNFINTINTSIVGPNPLLFTPNTGSCVISPTTPKTITVYSNATPTFNSVPVFCSGTPAPSFPISNEGISGSWIPNTISNSAGTKTYQFTPDVNNFPCAPIPPPLSVTVLPSATPTFLPSVPTDVCEAATLPDLPSESNDTPPITGSWSTLTVNPITAIDTSIVGTEAYTFTPDAGQCANAIPSINITVNPSDTLTGITWTVTDAFTENQTITVIATATGDYLYQLDSGPKQTSPIFENVSPGIHSVTVSDANGCSVALTETNILVIKHPKYFTPNGDGFNDTWNISGLSSSINNKMYIFDRYGKLLKEIATDGAGWDGTYLGAPVPADDYWFTIDYVENLIVKKFKSHFSLKR
jgi:gliding motility-associated-like protein